MGGTIRALVLVCVAGIDACAGVFAGAVGAYDVLLPPLPAPLARPLPEAAREALWAAHGGGAGERRLGVGRFAYEIGEAMWQNTSSGWRPRPIPVPGISGSASRATLTDEERERRGLDWHSTLARRNLRIARWWTADQALDVLGERSFFGSETWGMRDAALLYYGTPLESLDPLQIALLASVSGRPSENLWCRRERLMERARALVVRLGQPPPTDAELLDALALSGEPRCECGLDP